MRFASQSSPWRRSAWLRLAAAGLAAAWLAPAAAQEIDQDVVPGPQQDFQGDLLDQPAEDPAPAPPERSDLPDIQAPESAEAEPEAEPEDPAVVLEKAFAELKSDDETVWRAAQETIARTWSKSGSDSMDLLLQRARKAMEKENWDRAIEHLTDLVNLAPDFAEGWNARATAYFRKGDYGESLADIAETLALEPRHFGALSGLGVILDELGREKEAAAAYRRALELHPNLEGPKQAIERLAPAVDGREA